MNNNKSFWIWHFGDYELYHSMQLNLRRQEFGADYPAFWKITPPYVSVAFTTEFYCSKNGYITPHALGKGYILIDSIRYAMGAKIPVSIGTHKIKAVISNTDSFPALFVESDVCPSNSGWYADNLANTPSSVGCEECFDSIEKRPDIFPFEYETKYPVSSKACENGTLYDFGTELFGYLDIENADPNVQLCVFYGESMEEAIDTDNSILFEYVCGKDKYRLTQRAFRYIYIKGSDTSNLSLSMEYEYLPLKMKGSFRCDNELFNRIYDTSLYTFHLNCREAFLDGIKRDRWVWSGDAYQSARINAYSFADDAICRRTAIGLIGREPIEQHLNTIIDYSLLWIIGLYEYYMTYGDTDFIKKIYPLTVRLMEFCETRLDQNGFFVGNERDWTFIDWSEIDKTGAVCAEQMLLIAAYSSLASISEVLGKAANDYTNKSIALKEKVNKFFWNDNLGAFIDSFESGNNNVTRHANIFAVMYDIATAEQTKSILKNVLKNDKITKITTPYFRGYELDVLAKLGEFEEIESALTSYWGGMLDLGATTIWEEYNPELSGSEHFAMYGSKYGKSLCHAWGAGPVYLFGRYYLGVYPTSAGYTTFNVEPNLGGLSEFSGIVPVADGKINVSLSKEKLTVVTDKSGGTLIWNNKKYTLNPNEEISICID